MNKQPKLIIDEDGSKYWYLNDECHREDGPAINAIELMGPQLNILVEIKCGFLMVNYIERMGPL
jgi:hypothetical protein